jgi:dTDP-4-amino-4,6-dideoxygalactose transaminase
LGDAGLLLTNDAALADKARMLRSHGAHARYFHETVGGNFRLDAMQAALLGVKLPHLPEYTAKRLRHACEYNRAFGALKGNGTVELLTPVTHSDRSHIVHQYTLRILPGAGWRGKESPRDALRKFLGERGIASEVYYPLALHEQQCFRGLGPFRALAVAERLAREVISLPVFPEMSAEERNAVIAAIEEFVG